MTMTTLRNAQVIEDNAGGIHLILLSDDMQVIAATSGYEHNPSNLHEDLKEFYLTGSVEGWEGLEDNPQELYTSLTETPAQIIAHADKEGVEHYLDRMGASGRAAFESRIIGPSEHQWLTERARHLATHSGMISNNPEDIERGCWIVDDMDQVAKAYYADLCYGVAPETSGEDAEQWFERHGIEYA